MNTVDANVRVVLEAFGAVERRDAGRLLALCQPDVRFHWPPSLPYGAPGGETSQGDQGTTWEAVWLPLQPTEAEQSMDPHLVAASDREVVVLWRQRGLGPDGERFESPVLGMYEVREGRLARAQMFYFDPEAVSAFLNRAGGGAGTRASGS